MSEKAQPGNTQSDAASIASDAAGKLQRKCACGVQTLGGGDCAECGKRRGFLQRKVATAAGDMGAPPIVREVLNSPGQALNAETRAFFEPRFRQDFSNVSVHTGARAADSAQSLNARAYAVGNDLVFGADQYRPGQLPGLFLLAHVGACHGFIEDERLLILYRAERATERARANPPPELRQFVPEAPPSKALAARFLLC
jgi:hypothetical protein